MDAAWLKNPQAYAGTATMPNFQLADDADDARHLRVPDRAEHAVSWWDRRARAGGEPGFQPVAQPEGSRRQRVRRILLRLLPCTAECGRHAGGRRSGTRTDAHRLQGEAGVAGDWLRNPKTYDPDTPCRTTASTRSSSGFCAVSSKQTDSDFLANVHLEPATPAQIAHGKALVTSAAAPPVTPSTASKSRPTSRRN
jgi:hypothetical protein